MIKIEFLSVNKFFFIVKLNPSNVLKKEFYDLICDFYKSNQTEKNVLFLKGVKLRNF